MAFKRISHWVFLGLLCLVMHSISGVAHATHLVGGEITYVYQGTNASGQMEYEVHCYIYRDCSSSNTNGTGFDASASIAVYQGSTLIANLSAPLDPGLVTDIIPQNPNNCAFLPDDLCIERAEYIVNVILNPSQVSYTLVHQRCCRSPVITNLLNPQDQGFSLTTTIPGSIAGNAPNSTPVFNELPQAFVCNNYPFGLDNSAMDADGDSLSYTLCPIYMGGSYIAPTPNPPTGPPFTPVSWAAGFNATIPLGAAAGLAINPLTGQLTGTPNIVGKFALGICVMEWRNGQMISSILRDFTIDVVTCNILAPLYAQPEPCSGLEVAFDQINTPSESYSWDFGVADSEFDVSDEAEPSFTYTDPGIYEVSLFFQTGTCADSLFFEVVAVDPWSTAFSWTDPECADGGWSSSLLLDTTNWIPDITFSWDLGVNSNPSSLNNIHPESVWFPAGESVTIDLNSSAFGCINNQSDVLELEPLPVASFDVESEPCSGLEVMFNNLSPNSGPFSWNFGAGIGLNSTETDPTIEFPYYGIFNVTLTAGAGSPCANSQSVQVEVLPEDPFSPLFDIQPLSLCDSTGYVLLQYTGSGADDIQWDFPGFWSATGDWYQGFFPAVGSYSGTVELYNAACDITSSYPIEATVPEPLQGVEYVVPNIFSPNRDSKNDAFSVALKSSDGAGQVSLDPGQFETFDLQIFNRWGTQVFSSQQAGKSWRAEEYSEGTYFVILRAQHVCDVEPFEYHGAVTLVR